METTDEQERQEVIRKAMSILGSARTEKKIAAARAVAESRKGTKWTEEQKQKLRAAQAARREREREEMEAAGLKEPVKEKRPRGRPRKQPDQTV